MTYYKVYVDGMKSLYTYLDKNNEYEIGDGVIVSFVGKKRSGIIIEAETKTEFEFNVLEILSKKKDGIKLSKEYVDLIKWMVNYYLSDFQKVVNALIPKGLKVKYKDSYRLENFDDKYIDNEIVKSFLLKIEISRSSANTKFKKSVIDKLVEAGELLEKNKKIIYNFAGINNDYPINMGVFSYFSNKNFILKEVLEKSFPKSKISTLIKNGVITSKRELLEVEDKFTQEINESISDNVTILNEEQLNAKNIIENSSDKYFLLKGVTGSGKTEVYINLIKNALKNGEGSMFLVPEISLTPQMLNRFKNEFRENIAILHSKLTETERATEWYNIYSGKKKIILGVRSAVFAPIQNLKYIILDEEHETTYKQDTNPRYNAKYVAIKRSLLEGCKVILGSATPSIESYYYAKTGLYNLITIDGRYKDALMPKIELVDMKEEDNSFFSKKLLEEIQKRLVKKEQVILLLNRKGYSTYIQCKDCGHVEECEHCSIKMSYYSNSNILKCNYCGKAHKFKNCCSKCESKNIIHSGKGIERVEKELKEIFDVNIIRVDSDLGRDKNFYKNMYFDFLEHKYDIMIGTQLVSKGLHFPNVTLVGVINSDIILNFPDFRASERTFQMMSQVSGRSGRGEKPGEVIIQTYNKEHFAISNVPNNSYEEFYEEEINSREIFNYPPFSKIINIIISSKDEKKLVKISKMLYDDIYNENVEIYGPMPRMVYKVKDRYRMSIFIKGFKNNIDLYKRFLRNKLTNYESEKDVLISVDIDPVSVL